MGAMQSRGDLTRFLFNKMERKSHPTHARVTLLAMWSIGILAAMLWVLSAIHGNDDLLGDILVILYLCLLLFFFIVCEIRMRICRCYVCKKWSTGGSGVTHLPLSIQLLLLGKQEEIGQ